MAAAAAALMMGIRDIINAVLNNAAAD